MKTLKSIYASAISAIITILAVVSMTIWSELSAPFKDWLKGFTGHHWITKSWLTLIIFALFFLLIRATNREPKEAIVRCLILTLIACAFLGTAIITGFYIFEYLKH